MIDVVLQLIIFFMYTSQMAQMSRTLLDLPEEAGEEATATDTGPLVVDLDAAGRILVDREPVTLDGLSALVVGEISKAGGDATKVELLIRADRNAAAAHLNDLARRLRDLGVGSWKLGTMEPRESAGGAP